MIFMNMVDRERELQALKKRLSSNDLELMIIYGRRRIGKTFLILNAVNGYDFIYYLATEKNNLRKFKELTESKYEDIKYVKEDWEAIFHYLRDKIIIIDEFPYMIKEDESILSTFQKIVDETLKGSKTKLILLGSSISMMEDAISYKSPLYGRRTASIELKELKFKDLKGFNFSLIDAIHVYGFAGGVPFYLTKAKTPFLKWINAELKEVDSLIKDEIDFMLRYEFSEIGTYKEILHAISSGKNTLGEIKDFVRISGDVSSYLNKLEKIGIIGKEFPYKMKKGARYYIKDNFTLFWFTFIYPNLSLIEEGIYEIKEDEYNLYLGRIFEKIAREYVKDVYKVKIESLWYKDVEIDIYGDGIAGECKWSEGINGEKVLYELKRKVEDLGLDVKKYIIFAKSFSKTNEEAEFIDLKKLEQWYKT
ncbi:ATP-binding protein [Saccharolobus islandicus]|uniref:ATPase n=2 Tax=Saccharolobus islandicus TaxID=43080 RepID=C3MX42_SACI4|nr:ATP-binding protein [Sulfolobus islandicus]ACP37722.1 ATPase [Sulfolobus islandicus M.14.25]ACP54918.1 ATPase [Sulfolobus islandicus M.16.27]